MNQARRISHLAAFGMLLLALTFKTAESFAPAYSISSTSSSSRSRFISLAKKKGPSEDAPSGKKTKTGNILGGALGGSEEINDIIASIKRTTKKTKKEKETLQGLDGNRTYKLQDTLKGKKEIPIPPQKEKSPQKSPFSFLEKKTEKKEQSAPKPTTKKSSPLTKGTSDKKIGGVDLFSGIKGIKIPSIKETKNDNPIAPPSAGDKKVTAPAASTSASTFGLKRGSIFNGVIGNDVKVESKKATSTPIEKLKEQDESLFASRSESFFDNVTGKGSDNDEVKAPKPIPDQASPEENKFTFAQRIESTKTGVVGLLAGGIALTPFAAFHDILFPGSFIPNGIAQWEFDTDMGSIETALFAIVYRYCVREGEETNEMLGMGVVGAFVLVRTLSRITIPKYCTGAPLDCKCLHIICIVLVLIYMFSIPVLTMTISILYVYFSSRRCTTWLF